MASASALRGLFRVGGLVGIGAGIHTALTGVRSVPGYRGPADARLDSELRFFGPFYCAYGIAVWRTAGDAHRDTAGVRQLAAVLFGAGAARAVGWRSVGRPSPHQLALLAVELAAPPLVVAWQSRLVSESQAVGSAD